MLKPIPRKKLHEVLKAVRADVEKGAGNVLVEAICANVSYIIAIVNSETAGQHYATGDVLKKLFVKWPDYSGNVIYPVKSVKAGLQNPSRAFWGAINMWEGEYGASRMKLLNFMIRETR